MKIAILNDTHAGVRGDMVAMSITKDDFIMKFSSHI